MDTRIKILWLLLVSILAFAPQTLLFPVLLIATAFCALAYLKVRPVFILHALMASCALILFSLAANALVFDATGDITILGAAGLSTEGLLRGLSIVCRMLAVLLWGVVVARSSNENSLARALEHLLHFLTRLHIPVAMLSMLVTFIIQFIPLVGANMQRLKNAQLARGILNNPRKRAKLYSLSLLVPLTVSLFQQAHVSTLALQDRAFSLSTVRYHKEPLTQTQWLFCCPVLICGLLLLFLALRFGW